MPTCQNCGNEWTWAQTAKNIFKFICPYCKEKQYLTAAARRKMSLFSLLPLVILPINAFVDFSWGAATIIIIAIIALFVIVYPFLTEISNEEESM